MTTEIEDMCLAEKLFNIRKDVQVIQKDSEGYGYKYASDDAILPFIHAALDKYRVGLYVDLVPGTLKIENTGKNVRVTTEAVYTWENIDRPEDKKQRNWIVVGEQKDVSQALGSGLTYCNRYFMLKEFQIATPLDDPDYFLSRKQEAEEAATKKRIDEANREERSADMEASEAIFKQIDKHISAYLNTLGGDKAAENAQKTKMVATIGKYVKVDGKPSGKYRKAKDSETAKKILADLQREFPV